jgi:hypothetical protein
VANRIAVSCSSQNDGCDRDRRGRRVDRERAAAGLRLGENDTLDQGSQSGLANEMTNGDVLPDCIALPAILHCCISSEWDRHCSLRCLLPQIRKAQEQKLTPSNTDNKLALMGQSPRNSAPNKSRALKARFNPVGETFGSPLSRAFSARTLLILVARALP